VGMTLDDTGAAVDTSVKDAWGVQMAGSTSERYGGLAQREIDTESALVYMRHRMYDPRLGRFTQTDPILGNRAFKHYGYASNNPVSMMDPLGLDDSLATQLAKAIMNEGVWSRAVDPLGPIRRLITQKVIKAVREKIDSVDTAAKPASALAVETARGQLRLTEKVLQRIEAPIENVAHPDQTVKGLGVLVTDVRDKLATKGVIGYSKEIIETEKEAIAQDAPGWTMDRALDVFEFALGGAAGGGKGLTTKGGNRFIYRALSEADVEAIQAGRRLAPRGSGGSVLEHIRGNPTKYISASESLEGAVLFDGGRGIAVISVDTLEATGSQLVPHKNVLQAVERKGFARDIFNVKRSKELLIKGGLDSSAIEEIID